MAKVAAWRLLRWFGRMSTVAWFAMLSSWCCLVFGRKRWLPCGVIVVVGWGGLLEYFGVTVVGGTHLLDHFGVFLGSACPDVGEKGCDAWWYLRGGCKGSGEFGFTC